MQLIDSHAHLNDIRYSKDREEVIKAIRKAGVTNIINVGADTISSRTSVKLADEHDFIYATVGVHPHYTDKMEDWNIRYLKSLASHKKVVAIGEIGLDYYYDHSMRANQKHWFRRQLQLAKELNLPVVIHDRDAHDDVLEILKDENISNGVFHCYSGSAEMAKIVLDMGFYISFGGVVTFQNARTVIDALRAVPLERLLIETDCPYLAPEPHRGKRNSSEYLPLIAEDVAGIRGRMDVEDVCNITAENARRLFGF